MKMPKSKFRSDGSSDRETAANDNSPNKKSKGMKFHERTGDFDEVAKAMAILAVLGVIVYLVFVVI